MTIPADVEQAIETIRRHCATVVPAAPPALAEREPMQVSDRVERIAPYLDQLGEHEAKVVFGFVYFVVTGARYVDPDQHAIIVKKRRQSISKNTIGVTGQFKLPEIK